MTGSNTLSLNQSEKFPRRDRKKTSEKKRRQTQTHSEITGTVASKLKNLSAEVLKDSSGVDGGSWTNTTLVGDTLLEVTMDTTDRELNSA